MWYVFIALMVLMAFNKKVFFAVWGFVGFCFLLYLWDVNVTEYQANASQYEIYGMEMTTLHKERSLHVMNIKGNIANKTPDMLQKLVLSIEAYDCKVDECVRIASEEVSLRFMIKANEVGSFERIVSLGSLIDVEGVYKVGYKVEEVILDKGLL